MFSHLHSVCSGQSWPTRCVFTSCSVGFYTVKVSSEPKSSNTREPSPAHCVTSFKTDRWNLPPPRDCGDPMWATRHAEIVRQNGAFERATSGERCGRDVHSAVTRWGLVFLPTTLSRRVFIPYWSLLVVGFSAHPSAVAVLTLDQTNHTCVQSLTQQIRTTQL